MMDDSMHINSNPHTSLPDTDQRQKPDPADNTHSPAPPPLFSSSSSSRPSSLPGPLASPVHSASPHAIFRPLLFTARKTLTPRPDTTPEPSFVGAHGKSIPLGDGSVAHRTSALRALNHNYPSPVLRHTCAKSAGAKNTTYSQPVIVRTYSEHHHHNHHPSPASSTRYRRPSSNTSNTSHNNHNSHAHHIPPASAPTPADSSADHAVPGRHAPAVGIRRVRERERERQLEPPPSLLSMARNKVKKTSLLPWQWVSGRSSDSHNHHDHGEAKLPPLEAFTYKGFLADLQANTSIRADLDRIAEICARSRYSLSNQYDAHVAPHGSGASFLSSVGGGGGGGSSSTAAATQPHAQHARSRRKGASPGGPTLQAVPSDDDDSSARHRRRRGAAGPRRRSAAYGTLETIMSSSRSSEEEKAKKKPAKAMQDEVRGRVARKLAGGSAAAAEATAAEAEAAETEAEAADGGSDAKTPSSQESRESRGSPAGQAVLEDAASAASQSLAPPTHKARHRPRSTSFARAMSASAGPSRSAGSAGSASGQAATHLLSEPALPLTSDGVFEIQSTEVPVAVAASASTSAGRGKNKSKAKAREKSLASSVDTRMAPAAVRTEHTAPPLADEGYLASLSSWIPWVAGVSGISGVSGVSGASTARGIAGASAGAAHQASYAAGSSHAEGSLRELLRAVESRPGKGKAVDLQP